MPHCYLTIDDSPSPYTKDMVDFLDDRGIQSLIFCIGHFIDHYGDENLIYAVQRGHILGNHAYTHTHFSQLDNADCIKEVEKTDRMIDIIYQKANIKRPGKYFRFPHMDRGTAGEIIDFDKIDEAYRDFTRSLFTDGIRIEPEPISQELIDKKNMIQNYLAEQGFIQPFAGITYPWFQGTELEEAKDCMYTFSTSDWMLLDRHRGQWPYQSLDDLKHKIDDDPWLCKPDSHGIILIHDKPEPELFPIFKSLVDYFLEKDYKFAPLQ